MSEEPKKLKNAEEYIQGINDTEQIISKHLKVLKILLGKYKGNEFTETDFDLKMFCEFGGRKIEDSIKIIVNSITLEDFLANLGFDVIISEDKEVMRKILHNKRTLNGEVLQNYLASESMFYEWFCLFNNTLYIHEKRLSQLKDEFSIVKQ